MVPVHSANSWPMVSPGKVYERGVHACIVSDMASSYAFHLITATQEPNYSIISHLIAPTN